MPNKLVLIVVDGLTPGLLEGALEELPALRFLAENGTYRRGTSVFPSLTPVCLSSIATGAHPDVHEIPHLVWYHRGERRLVEYGSSFGAVVAAGLSRSLRDTILNMNARHLGSEAVTLFEAAEDAGLVTASVNFTAYRGRTRHRSALPASRRHTGRGGSSSTASTTRTRPVRSSRCATVPRARSTTTPRRSVVGS